MKSHHIVNFIIYLLLFAPFSLFLQVKSHPPITGKFKKWRTFCFLLQNKTICEFEKTTATLITKRLPSFPLIFVRRRFLCLRPPFSFSRSDAKPNSNNWVWPPNCGRAWRCPLTKSATEGKEEKWEEQLLHHLSLVFPSTWTDQLNEEVKLYLDPSVPWWTRRQIFRRFIPYKTKYFIP